MKPKNPKLNSSMANKIFFIVFGLLIAGSVAVTYWRIMVKRDYIISAQQECDPALEACFVYECDPEDPEDPECAALPEEERVNYYKIIRKNAKNIPPCDAQNNECPEVLICEEGEEECEFEYCTEENVPEGESCNNPEEYLAENPPEECGCEGEDADSPLTEKETETDVDSAEPETPEVEAETGAGEETAGDTAGSEEESAEESSCDCSAEE
ncbi:MAG: hypothetical protein FJZ04_00220 [Candidatus Moranbacteria bacterium]|nr:hypothetical protein [Candidatus Moranbacteria bacterium]